MFPTATCGNEPSNQSSLVGRSADIARAKKPLWAEAKTRSRARFYRIIQLHADGRHVFLHEREVSLEGNGPGMGIGL